MFLLMTSLVLVRVPRVQTFLIQQISDYLSSELKTNVHIGSLRLQLVKTVVLKDVYVEDLHHDTLLNAAVLKIDISKFNRQTEKLKFNNIELQRARIKLQRYKNEDYLNHQFIVDYFASSEKDTSSTMTWDVSADNFKLTNVKFSLHDHRYNDTTCTVDFSDLFVDSLNTHFSDVTMNGDTVFTTIKNISFREKSGFVLNHFEAAAKIAPDQMSFNKLDILTPNSHIQTDLDFKYTDFNAFEHFLTQVQFKSDFKESKIASADIAHFTSDLKGFDRSVILSGSVRGTVDKMKAKNLSLSYGNKTVFKGNVNLEGLPEIEETFIDLVVDDLTTVASDLETIPLAPFTGKVNLQLPPEVSRMGLIKFKGKFTGFYNDFVAYGNLNTALGFLSSDINLKFEKEPTYAGHITTHDFDIGKLWASENVLGKLSMNAEIKGRNFNADKVAASIKGTISGAEVFKYKYHNITLDGNVAKRLFNGSLSVDEENLQLSFDGKIDYSQKIPVFDFKADIDKAKLGKLNLIKRDTSATLSLTTDLNITGSNIDNMDGYTKFRNIDYRENENHLHVNEIALKSKTNGGQKQVFLTSDLLDLEITGQYKRSSIIKSFANVIRKYLPYVEQTKMPIGEMQNFAYNLKLKDTKQVLDIFLPQLKVAPGTSLSGNFNTMADDLKLNLASEKIIYGDFICNNVLLDGKTTAGRFLANLTINELVFHDSVSFRNLSLDAATGNDSASFNFKFVGKDSTYDRLDLRGNVAFNTTGKTMVHLLPSVVFLEGYDWKINNDNRLLIDTTGTDVQNFVFTSGVQQFGLSGKISSLDSDALNVLLTKFETRSLSKLLSLYDVNIGGTADGKISVAAVTSTPKISSDLKITNFSFFGDTIGLASLVVDFNTKAKVINVDATVTKADVKNIVIKGKYFIKNPHDEMDFSVTLQKTNMQPFGHYLNSFASDVRGYITADLKLKGLANKPELTGMAKVQKGSFIVDYLNTRYSFSDEVLITGDGFNFKNITLNDENGNKATLNGRIYHDYFRNFGIDIDINTNRFLCLNTNKTQNELYYGSAYASGVFQMSGLFENLDITGTVRSEKGTHIFIPLSNPEEVATNGFITFISHDTTKIKTEAPPVDLSGVSMDFTFEATPAAQIELVFDEKIGDKMVGTGSGTIKMEIDRFGTFNMFGEYVVERGDYTFTLQNVISKQFDVDRGGTIKWNGSPYDAIIDISANYKVRASLFDLLQDTTAAYKKRLDVMLNLNLKNKLMNPDVSFKIDIPDIDPTTESRVKKEFNSEQEINKQALSLLVLNRFSPAKSVDRVGSSGGTFGSTASEFLSSQLSNWAQSLTNAFDIGINYKAGDNLNSEELEVALSTKLFSDRVRLEGVVGVSGNNDVDQRASNIVGDFNVDVQVSDNGRFHFKAFNRSNNNTFLNYFNSIYTQGVGVFYRQEFDTVGDLFKRNKDKGKNKKTDETSINQKLP